eukprot:COSAG06_NODE_24527_length_660_cov_0.720143_1_plen_92_part_10
MAVAMLCLMQRQRAREEVVTRVLGSICLCGVWSVVCAASGSSPSMIDQTNFSRRAHAILGVISTDSDHYPLASAIVACIGLVGQRKGHPRVL